jgi:hypothetical protein
MVRGRINFGELYRRHLCRHSEWGINVWHLVAVVGIYLALLSLVRLFPNAVWIVGAGSAAYLGLLALTVPPRVWVACAALVAGLATTAFLLPAAPWWLPPIVFVVLHRFQVWQHRMYRRSYDMAEFAGKYQKGPKLALLLAVYELPILLNYLLFADEAARVPQS